MNEVKSIQLQLEKLVLTLGYRIQSIYWALNELKNITDLLFELTPCDDQARNTWLQQEQFEQDDQGYFKSLRLIKMLHNQKLPSNTITYQWPASLKNNSDLGFRFYALRNIGKYLEEIKQKLGKVTILYYQDITYNACLAYPYFEMNGVIPANFNWQEYHSCLSVNPHNNPERKIQWAPPNIDYAGEGLIAIASTPIYKEDAFVGVWSIDVPLNTIHQDCILDTYVPGQLNFITDYQGKIIIHPTIETKIDKKKGAFFQLTINDLGEGFGKLNLHDLISDGKGVVEVTNDQGVEVYIVYHVVADIQWILFGTFSKDVMFQSVQNKISDAFDNMKKSNLPYKIDFEVGSEMHMLVNSYNDMVEVLDYNQKERNKAQQEALKAQHILHEELDEQVKSRTAELLELNKKLESLANTDPLTGMYNRRYFFEVGDKFFENAKRDNLSFAIVMLDIDFFKKINDTHGHDAGDFILKNISNRFTEQTRKSDIVARFGGEEFCILLTDTDKKVAMTVTEKIRKTIEKQNFIFEEKHIPVTVSCGISYKLKDSLEGMIKQADLMLYEGKSSGRNRTVVEN